MTTYDKRDIRAADRLMTLDRLPVSVLCPFGIACSAGDTDSRRGSSNGAPHHWEWVYVAGLDNPGLSPEADRALNLLVAALAREGIRWSACGSVGYSLNIDSRDLPRGREIVRELVERYDLPVRVAPE